MIQSKIENGSDKTRALLLISCLFYSIFTFAQKRPLDLSAAITWPKAGNEQISNNGKYVSYIIQSGKSSELVVKAVAGNWERKIKRFNTNEATSATYFEQGKFTEDSRHLVVKFQSDSLAILDITRDSICFVAGVTSYTTPQNGNGEWLVCRLKSQDKRILLCNLRTGEQVSYPGINWFAFNEPGTILVLKKESKISDTSLLWVTLSDRKEKVLARDYEIGQPVFNSKGNQLIYSAVKRDKRDTGIQMYTEGSEGPRILANTQSGELSGMAINTGTAPFFSSDDKQVFFYINEPAEKNKKSEAKYKNVDIRRYYDETGSPYAKENQSYKTSLATVQLGDYKIQRIKTSEGDRIRKEHCFGEVILGIRISPVDVIQRISQPMDHNPALYDIVLFFPVKGERITIKKSVNFGSTIGLSPSNRYVYWFDRDSKNWTIYDIKNSIVKNVTKGIKTALAVETNGSRQRNNVTELIGWTTGDSIMLVRDRSGDVWSIDPQDKRIPVNASNGFAGKNHIQLSLLGSMGKNEKMTNPQKVIAYGDTLLFYALNEKTKETGFYQLKLTGLPTDPQKLGMGPDVYFRTFSSHSLVASSSGQVDLPLLPLKAKFTRSYLVKKMNAAQFPTLCVTSDFKTFVALTDIQPQKEYNWFVTELHHWKLPGGKEGSGILYKPENFNPKKKYPVLFYYYELGTSGLNYYINHALSEGTLPIPWFVSNEYLVFVPDIYYTVGNPGASACNAVVSAANYLSKLSFVDSKHMGLQGHSFGGYETNYIVSHSTLFAAAAPAEGVSDIISDYSGDWRGGTSYYETGQARMGQPLWKIPNKYIKNSPVFSANKVVAPILILHNKNDINIPYNPQGFEWYSILVRTGKKVWMLSYDEKADAHTISDPDNQYDYSVKLMQFFDHFLKGKPKPDWM